MTLKPYKDKLNDRAFSIGISKRLPDNSTNLAFASSPKISKDNISTMNDFEGISKLLSGTNYELFYSSEDNLLSTNNGITFIPNQMIELTDEFSLKVLPNDIPHPLFYESTLSKPIKAITTVKNVVKNSVPYVYGYESRTMDQLRVVINSNDKTDITSFVDVIENITNSNGVKVNGDFKVRLTKIDDNDGVLNDAYQVRLYHNFDDNDTYKVTYRQYDGTMKSEILTSIPIFNRINIEDFQSAGTMDKVYAVKQDGVGFNVYAPTNMYRITDNQREPFEFRYRVLGNMDIKYDKYSPAQMKIGVLSFERWDGLNETEGIVSDFINQSLFPEYISFINPHPPSKYYDSPENYFNDSKYWTIDLSMPQQYLDEYNLIIITGYGIHDLSAYNGSLVKYLEQGGNILIDNLSNENTLALRLNFGDTNPIIDYDYMSNSETGELLLNTAAREFVSTGKYLTRHYDLTEVNASKLAYIENSFQVGPSVYVNETDVWSNIVRYSTAAKCIGYLTHEDRGKVYLSTSGILKAFTQETNEENKKFVVNLIITIAEDMWLSTPWIKDRVYHIDQLFDDEINNLGYEYAMSINNTPIAKKALGKQIKDVLAKYTNYKYYNQNGTYHIIAEEYDKRINTVENSWKPLNKVYVPSTLDSNDELYAYAVTSNSVTFNTDNLQGYSKNDIKIYNDKVKFKFIIRPYTYSWINDNGVLKKIRIDGDRTHISEKEYEITRSDGFINLGPLSSMLPELPDGIEWAKKRSRVNDLTLETLDEDIVDKRDIFFEVLLGHFQNGEFVELDQKVNLMIYDKATGEYKYAGDGRNVISYNDLFDVRKIQTNADSNVLRRKSEDIIIQASTNYYVLAANKRVFAIKHMFNSESAIVLPSSLNTNENWHPRIKHLNFIKNSFTKEDYDRIARTLRFRFEDAYVIDTITQYYGENPGDNVILSIIAKLNNNEILDSEDWEVVSEAFDLIDDAVLYEYETKEYHNQAWNPLEPLKKSTKETSKYIDSDTIKVQFPNIYIVDQSVEREKLERISDYLFKSVNLNWLQSELVKIEVADTNEIGGYRTINPDRLTIDFNKGVVTLKDLVIDKLYATYTYSNVEIYKKLYSNSSAIFEELNQLDAYHYDVTRISSEARILKSPSPVVYFADTYSELEQAIINKTDAKYLGTSFEIDYDRGFLTLTNPTTKRIFMRYHYEQVESLSIKDYDSKQSVIELNEHIHFNDNVYVTYFYNDDSYEYKGYKDSNKYRYLDMNPTRGHVCTVSVVEDGEVVFKEVPTYTLLDKSVYFYMMPSRVMRQSTANNERLIKLSDTEFISENQNWITRSYMSIKKLGQVLTQTSYQIAPYEEWITIDSSEYTIDKINGKIIFNKPQTSSIYATYSYYEPIIENDVTLRHTFDKEELRLIQLAHPEMIVLGSIKITNDYTKYDIVSLDTRTRGGGLKDTVSREQINTQDQLSNNFWDISDFDGPSYYGNGITIIKVPNSVLNKFTKKEVEEIVKNHLAYGILPIIKYYDEI